MCQCKQVAAQDMQLAGQPSVQLALQLAGQSSTSSIPQHALQTAEPVPAGETIASVCYRCWCSSPSRGFRT